jgi:hypothetical protein
VTHITLQSCDHGSTERRVVVTGTPEAVHQAIVLLDERVKEWQARSGFAVQGINNISAILNKIGSYTPVPAQAAASTSAAQYTQGNPSAVIQTPHYAGENY